MAFRSRPILGNLTVSDLRLCCIHTGQVAEHELDGQVHPV